MFFCFVTRIGTRLKLMVWDGSELRVCAKKLSRGRFRWPQPRAGEVKVVLSHEELAMLLGGTEAR
jgi:transposase